jgi:hypothetical protein
METFQCLQPPTTQKYHKLEEQVSKIYTDILSPDIPEKMSVLDTNDSLIFEKLFERLDDFDYDEPVDSAISNLKDTLFYYGTRLQSFRHNHCSLHLNALRVSELMILSIRYSCSISMTICVSDIVRKHLENQCVLSQDFVKELEHMRSSFVKMRDSIDSDIVTIGKLHEMMKPR